MGNINEHCHPQTGFAIEIPVKDGEEGRSLLFKGFWQHFDRL
jgi:hypothetical protein